MSHIKLRNIFYKKFYNQIIELESLLKEIGFVLNFNSIFSENFFFGIVTTEEYHLELDYETKDVLRIAYYKYNCLDDGDVNEEFSYDIYIESNQDIKKLLAVIQKIKSDFSIRLRKRKIESLLNG